MESGNGFHDAFFESAGPCLRKVHAEDLLKTLVYHQGASPDVKIRKV